MRKIKPKMTKQEKREYKATKVLNETCKPLYNVGLILSVFVDYLQEHRKLYDDKEAYLKPYLKSILTSTINKTKDFIEYNYFKEKVDSYNHISSVKKVIEDNFTEELKCSEKIRKEFFSKNSGINGRLFQTYACALTCIGTIVDMFIKKEKNPIYNDFKNRLMKIFKEFKIYDNFWQREVEDLKVTVI